jgi:hypothetical protein
MDIPKAFYENMSIFGGQLIGFTKAACRAMPNEEARTKTIELVSNILDMAIGTPIELPEPAPEPAEGLGTVASKEEGGVVPPEGIEEPPKSVTRRAAGRRTAKKD